jgi:hypothetical protein
MNCRKVRLCLFSYFKNELSESEKAEIKLHLEGCPECARESMEVERTCFLIKESLETLTPSADFNQKLFFEIQKLSPAKGGAKEVKSPSFVSLLTFRFPLRIRWVFAGFLAGIILVSVLWFTQRPTPIKPQAISAMNKKAESLKLADKPDSGDSLYKEMLGKLVKSSGFRTKTFVLDNYRSTGLRGIDGMEKSEDMFKKFIIETAGQEAGKGRTGNHYVLPVVSTQQVSGKVNY